MRRLLSWRPRWWRFQPVVVTWKALHQQPVIR